MTWAGPLGQPPFCGFWYTKYLHQYCTVLTGLMEPPTHQCMLKVLKYVVVPHCQFYCMVIFRMPNVNGKPNFSKRDYKRNRTILGLFLEVFYYLSTEFLSNYITKEAIYLFYLQRERRISGLGRLMSDNSVFLYCGCCSSK